MSHVNHLPHPQHARLGVRPVRAPPAVALGRRARATDRALDPAAAPYVAGLVVVLVLRSAGGGLSAWDLAAPLAVNGFGMGMVFVPMFDVILAGVEPHQLGSASGLLESVQQLAMAVGIAATGTVLFDRLGQRFSPAAFVDSAGHGLLVAIGLLLAAAIAGVRPAPPRAVGVLTPGGPVRIVHRTGPVGPLGSSA